MHGSKQQTDSDRINVVLGDLSELLLTCCGHVGYHGEVSVTVTYHNGQIVGYSTKPERRVRFDCEKPRPGRQLVDRLP